MPVIDNLPGHDQTPAARHPGADRANDSGEPGPDGVAAVAVMDPFHVVALAGDAKCPG